MNDLPRWIILFFSEFFNGAQLKVINRDWYRLSQLSLNNSTREELLNQARTILVLAKI